MKDDGSHEATPIAPATDVGLGMDVEVPGKSGGAVLTRDFLTFAAKLLLNASLEVVMLPLATLAYAVDLLTGRPQERSRFYAVLRLGRRWDGWLRVFRPASRLRSDPKSIAQGAATGADQLIASVEHMIAEGDLPSRYRAQVEEWSARMRRSQPRDDSGPEDLDG